VGPEGPRPIPAGIEVDSVELGSFEEDPDGFVFLDGRTGARIDFAEVKKRALASEAILVGEQHDQGAHHRLQARVIEAVAGDDLAVGLEMVVWGNQKKLDRYNRGDVDIDGLFAALDWEKTWGHHSELYRLVFETGREVGARFVALNAPRELVRKVARGGLDGLSKKERRALPELDLGDTAHRARIEAFFREHHPPTKGNAFDNFYTAQVLWDESMADRSARALKRGASRVVVLAGVGHVAGYRGIYQRLLRRRPGVKAMTIVPITVEAEEEPADVAKEALARGAGDIIAIKRAREVISL
jgi:uncharacterized iron-regulated protein